MDVWLKDSGTVQAETHISVAQANPRTSYANIVAKPGDFLGYRGIMTSEAEALGLPMSLSKGTAAPSNGESGPYGFTQEHKKECETWGTQIGVGLYLADRLGDVKEYAGATGDQSKPRQSYNAWVLSVHAAKELKGKQVGRDYEQKVRVHEPAFTVPEGEFLRHKFTESSETCLSPSITNGLKYKADKPFDD